MPLSWIIAQLEAIHPALFPLLRILFAVLVPGAMLLEGFIYLRKYFQKNGFRFPTKKT